MRKSVSKDGRTVKLWLSKDDTFKWAARLGQRWPCSQFSGKRVYAELVDENLVDFKVNGRYLVAEIDGNELNALVSDYLNHL